MKRNIVLLLSCILLFISNCKENPQATDETYSVSGSVEYAGFYKENVSVVIDNKINWTTTTDNSGYFNIQNVSAGNHTLVISKENEDGSFGERSNAIAVYDDIVVDNLKLPNPVFMYDPAEVTANSVSLKWSPSIAADFREYKIYRHNTSGLDETTGTLAHVSTDIDDTLFVDTNLNPLQTYFYRVYVMNEYGRLGGSNIMQATTGNFNAIANGSFEIPDTYTQFPAEWAIGSVLASTCIEYDSTVSFEGKYSLHFYALAEEYAFSMVEQIIDTDKLIAGARYEVSYWAKHDSLYSYHGSFTELYPVAYHMCEFTGPRDSSDWVRHSETLTIPADANPTHYSFQLSAFQIYNVTVPVYPLNFWVDNVELSRIE